MTLGRVRLGVVSMDELPAAAQRVAGDYPALYARLVLETGVETVDFAGHLGRLPASVHDCDGWLIGGSRRSVLELRPSGTDPAGLDSAAADVGWMRDAAAFVRAAADAERPLVGICFGHQLVAHALGGRVTRAPGGWGLGAQDYAVVSPLRWYDEPVCTLVASHQDQVTVLPPDAELWAEADSCPIAGMTVGDHVWTLQGHPEFTPGVATELYGARIPIVGPDAVAAARASLARPLSNDAVGRAIAAFVARRTAAAG